MFAKTILGFWILLRLRTHIFQFRRIVLQFHPLAHAAEQMIQHTLFWVHSFVKAIIHPTPKPREQGEKRELGG